MIVAINKIDKQGANPEKAMSSLIRHDVVVEEMGGEFASVCISAKNKTNLDKLEDAFYRKYTFFDTRNVFFRYRTSCNLAFKLKIAF